MATTSTLTKIGVSLKLNNGTSATGAARTVSVSFPELSKETGVFDADKVMAIVTALSPVLSKTIVKVQKTSYEDIANAA